MMNTPVPSIRAAGSGDYDAIVELLRSSALPVEGVSDALPGFVVADAGGEIVGVAGVETSGTEGLLRSTAVASSWQGRALGRALVERVIGDAKSRGLHELYLLTTTAEAWFPAFGFQTVARDTVPESIRATAEFTTACPASAAVMRLRLD